MRSSGLKAALGDRRGRGGDDDAGAAAGQTAPAGAAQPAADARADRRRRSRAAFSASIRCPSRMRRRSSTRSGMPLRVVPMVKGLPAPWSLAFLPNGDMLVTEKGGALRIVRGGTLDPTAGRRARRRSSAQGQGGLLEVALHPQFAQNQFVYLTYSKADREGRDDRAGARPVRRQGAHRREGYLRRRELQHRRRPLRIEARVRPRRHALHDRRRAQRSHARAGLDSHGGKVLRLKDDGTVPPDNPFVGKAGSKPEIYSYGHRNLQGLAIHPETGALWETEHGPQGGDELNLVEAGQELRLAGDHLRPRIQRRGDQRAAGARRAWSSRTRSGRRRRACRAWRSTPATSSRGRDS